jgi:uncharacterized membrane protein YuzA (DUF378 family)
MNHSGKVGLHITLVVIILIGALNWGLIGLFDYDLVKDIGSLFGPQAQDDVSRFIYILVAIAAVVLMFQRETFLPFLGSTVMPQPVTEYTPTGDLVSKTVKNLPANVKVIYWASLPSDTVFNNPQDAYDNYKNQGITTTDDNGVAILQVLNPSSYKVPIRGTLKPHIHYRYWTEAGVASKVYTIKM